MERKSITNAVRNFLVIWNIGLFALVWELYYNKYAFDTHIVLGGALSCLLYGIVYLFLCKLYKSFRIASMQIGETVFSQVLCFGMADLLFYAECCLIYNRPVNILPGLATVVLQIAGTACLVVLSKRYMMKHLPRQNTIIIYGQDTDEEEITEFRDRLMQKYSHLFDIREMIPEKDIVFCMEEAVQNAETVLLYEVGHRARKQVMKYAIAHKKNMYFTPTIEDITLQGCTEKHLLDTPLLKYNYVYETASDYTGKRLFDIALSLTLIILTSPFMLLTALAIKLEDGGPVFFKQKRCTKNGRVFKIIKFRSMIVDAEKHGVTPCTKNDSRITKVGNIIRKTRLDELPQLLNILKGDMSFVGPRPERVEHVEKYTKELPEFAYRMRVKGGLTGYAQIYGKYNTSAYDKLRLDLTYIENQSFILDLKMIMLTIKVMFIPESTEGFEKAKSLGMREEVKKADVAVERRVRRGQMGS